MPLHPTVVGARDVLTKVSSPEPSNGVKRSVPEVHLDSRGHTPPEVEVGGNGNKGDERNVFWTLEVHPFVLTAG